jgi:hypothetical protein
MRIISRFSKIFCYFGEYKHKANRNVLYCQLWYICQASTGANCSLFIFLLTKFKGTSSLLMDQARAMCTHWLGSMHQEKDVFKSGHPVYVYWGTINVESYNRKKYNTATSSGYHCCKWEWMNTLCDGTDCSMLDLTVFSCANITWALFLVSSHVVTPFF